MSHPYNSASNNAYNRRQHSLHTRIPRRQTTQAPMQTRQAYIGEITLQNAESDQPSPSFSSLPLFDWITGAFGPAPGYKAAIQKGLVNADTQQRIKDMRTVLNENKHGQLQLLVKEHLDVDPHWNQSQIQQHRRQIFQNGKTEFFLNLEEAKNLPAHIANKYCNTDDNANFCMNDGISFMVPTRILPEDFLSNDKKSIKSWLGLAPNVDFQLFSNRHYVEIATPD